MPSFVAFVVTTLLFPFVLSDPCFLCSDGSEITQPDFVINNYLADPLTCQQMAIGISFFIPDENSEDCEVAHRYGTLCGCPKREDACSLCPDGSEIADDRRTEKIPELHFESQFYCVTCECIQAYLQSFGKSDATCSETQALAWELCGCPAATSREFYTSTVATSERGSTLFPEDVKNKEGAHYYWPGFFGTKNPEEIDFLNLLVRVSACLSILGALAVIQDTLRSQERRKQVYSQLAATMAAIDILYATAVALQDIPRPTDDFFFAKGERGNDATCIAQGVIIQFSAMASLFFNCALATYFTLAIVYRATPSMLSKYQTRLLAIPVVLGFILAVCSFPMISTEVRGCYLVPPHHDLVLLLELTGVQASWFSYSFLFLVPGFCGIAYTTAAMVVVVRHVRKVHATSSRWTFDGHASSTVASSNASDSRRMFGSSSFSQQLRACRNSITARRRRTTNNMKKLERQVTIQCGMYLLSLYSTWVVYFCLAPNPNNVVYKSYDLWKFVSIMMPLQGFLNSFIYFRPRFTGFCDKLVKDYKQRRQQSNANKQNDTEAVARAAPTTAPVPRRPIEPSVEIIAQRRLDQCASAVDHDDESADEPNWEVCCQEASSLPMSTSLEGSSASEHETLAAGEIKLDLGSDDEQDSLADESLA